MTVPSSTRSDPRPASRRLGTIDDVLEVLPLPKSSVYELARYGRMPGVVRVGRRLLFDLDAITTWIDSGGGGTGVNQ